MIIARRMTPHIAAMTSSAMNKPRQFFASYPTMSYSTHYLYIGITVWSIKSKLLTFMHS